MARSKEPVLWALFSGGGMLSALLLPAIVFVLWVGAPLEWVAPPSYETLAALARSLLVRAVVFGLVMTSLFHWAHRFRYTLYDGLQLYHLNELIAIVTYGLAAVMSLGAAYVLFV